MGHPKQFVDLRGRPALYHTLRAFEDAPQIERIYAVGDRRRIEGLAEDGGITKYAGCAEPGETRSLSARSGLLLCGGESEASVVLVHDGSRCLLTTDLVERVVRGTRTSFPGADGVIPTLPVTDTVKVAENGWVLRTLDRSKLHAVQTPQGFRLGLLCRIYAAPEGTLRAATDDASLVEDAGGRVVVVAGEKTNIKLTTPEDLILAEAILAARESAGVGGRWTVR